jgi:hypothetical protein
MFTSLVKLKPISTDGLSAVDSIIKLAADNLLISDLNGK